MLTPKRAYFPLRERRGLFQEFAALEPTQEGIVQFANQWGFLQEGAVYGIRLAVEYDGQVSGESFEIWQHAILAMRCAVHVWRLVEKRDATSLSRLIQSHTDPERGVVGWLFKEHDLPNLGNSFLDGDAVPPMRTSPDVVEVGRCFVAAWINLSLGQAGGCNLFQIWSPVRRKYGIRIVPVTLLAAMWWQFAREFAGEARYDPCKVCGRQMEIGSGAFREDREFCTPACRQKDHRARVKRARELQSKGVSLQKIAKQLETSSEVIQNWLAKKK